MQLALKKWAVRLFLLEDDGSTVTVWEICLVSPIY